MKPKSAKCGKGSLPRQPRWSRKGRSKQQPKRAARKWERKGGQQKRLEPLSCLPSLPISTQHELAILVGQPAGDWYEDVAPAALITTGAKETAAVVEAHPEARDRARVMTEIDQSLELPFPDLLGTYVRGLPVMWKEEDPTSPLGAREVEKALKMASEQGGPKCRGLKFGGGQCKRWAREKRRGYYFRENHEVLCSKGS